MQDDNKKLVSELRNNKYFNYTFLRKGIVIFIAITLVAFTGLFLYSNSGESIQELKNIRLVYIPFVLGLVFFDWWLGAWRNTIFVRKLIPNVSQRICFDANLANIFMGAVTPSQTGGGPMQLYILHRNGVKLAHGIAISVINFISTIIFFFISSGLALWCLQHTEMNDSLFTLIKSGFTIFTSLLMIILLGLIAPKLLSGFLIKFGNQIFKLSKQFGTKINSSVEKINQKLFEYNDAVMLFLRKNPWLLPYSLVITFIMYFNKFLIAYLLMKGLGYEAPFWQVISVQAITFFLLYFAPTPGGSGIAEFSIATLMAPFIPVAGISSFTILHRCFLLLLPAIVGAIIVIKELKKHSED